ncbi:hypothetical protein J0X12_16210 [Sneathiella sp. CAU 1612]|uniref:SxtJ n=1 Tax=Sneathiella sedimenti TaxID=2816034 RepID=A0ABS3F9F4_9PROT|nr:SxtJ family membrane protein [Sneathiella sedimenti]MBO0335167.1 hypothetical protein [Sneathiella sedimenti]
MSELHKQAMMPSDRKFGIFFALVFLAVAIYFGIQESGFWAVLFAIAAAVFGLFAVISPRRLHFLNNLWFKFGLLLSRIVNPLVLGLIFFVLLTPLGIAMRMFGRDELKLRKRNVETYWVKREPTGPEPETFKNQF